MRPGTGPSGGGRAIALALGFTALALACVGGVALTLDVLEGGGPGESVRRLAPVLAGIALPIAALLSLLFRFAFGHADRTAHDLAHEGVAMHGAVHLVTGPLKRGGALVLTGQRLVFVPHRLSLGAPRTDVPLGDVREVLAENGLGGLGRLVVYLRGGDALVFEVRRVARWEAGFAALGIRRAGRSGG